jgi:DNA topoisomerase-1
MTRLRRADCAGPGIRRRGRGRGFEYVDEDGRRIGEPEVVQRIAELAIPPAWKDVWICPYPNGHLQATGIDDAGRKQYRYHDVWRARRDAEKFEDMLDFAEALPALRKRVAGHLRRPELDRAKALACSVRLLDLGFFRVGSEESAETVETYGLTTILKRHVTIDDGWLIFAYDAKGGQKRVQAIADGPVLKVVSELKARRGGGDELLAYREGRRWRDVKAEDVNAYLKEHAGEQFSAKDFRTWNATVLAAVALAHHAREATSKTSRKRAVTASIKTVSAYLGNTPAVARASYIDPRVIDRFLSGWTIVGLLDELGGEADLAKRSHRDRVEDAVLDLLEDRRSSPALVRAA